MPNDIELDRVETIAAIVDELLQDPATVDAIADDGWPRPMVERGLALHAKTWRADEIADALRVELAVLTEHRTPRTMTHIWPALPGAGVTSVLQSWMLGIDRIGIRPSRRGANFGRHFVDTWRRHDDRVFLTENYREAERVVVSGSDETIAALIGELGHDRIVGYGDRQSFAVVVDDEHFDAHYANLALDVAMWFGRGCLSAHAVVLRGSSEERAVRFAAELAAALESVERELYGAWSADEGMFAARAQAMGVAEFDSEVTIFGALLGYVELRRDAWDGSPRPASTVVVCPDGPQSIGLHPRHRQAMVWGGSMPDGRDPAAEFAVSLVCAPGNLQAPPPDWRHDGVSNAAALLGLRSGRIGL